MRSNASEAILNKALYIRHTGWDPKTARVKQENADNTIAGKSRCCKHICGPLLIPKDLRFWLLSYRLLPPPSLSTLFFLPLSCLLSAFSAFFAGFSWIRASELGWIDDWYSCHIRHEIHKYSVAPTVFLFFSIRKDWRRTTFPATALQTRDSWLIWDGSFSTILGSNILSSPSGLSGGFIWWGFCTLLVWFSWEGAGGKGWRGLYWGVGEDVAKRRVEGWETVQ